MNKKLSFISFPLLNNIIDSDGKLTKEFYLEFIKLQETVNELVKKEKGIQ